jgi:hypothetical protein
VPKSASGVYAKGMPRFSLRDLLIATALISIGMGLIYVLYTTPLFRERHFMPRMKYIAPPLFFSGSALIGAGICAPFQRKLIGGLIGFLIPTILFLLAYARLRVFVPSWLNSFEKNARVQVGTIQTYTICYNGRFHILLITRLYRSALPGRPRFYASRRQICESIHQNSPNYARRQFMPDA